MKIKGLEKLTLEQQELMKSTNERHTLCVGGEYKEGMQIIEAWTNEDNCVCVRLKNGQWFHYTKAKEWY